MNCLICDKTNNLNIINSTGNCIYTINHNIQLPIVKYYSKDNFYYTCEHTIKKILLSKYGHILYDNPIEKYINDFIINNNNNIDYDYNYIKYKLYSFELLPNSCFYKIEFLPDIDNKEIFETDGEDEKDETKKGEETKKELKKSNKKDINICNGIKKDKSQCNKKGSELHNELHYCKVHLKQIIKLENTISDSIYDKEEEFIEKSNEDEFEEETTITINISDYNKLLAQSIYEEEYKEILLILSEKNIQLENLQQEIEQKLYNHNSEEKLKFLNIVDNIPLRIINNQYIYDIIKCYKCNNNIDKNKKTKINNIYLCNYCFSINHN